MNSAQNLPVIVKWHRQRGGANMSHVSGHKRLRCSCRMNWYYHPGSSGGFLVFLQNPAGVCLLLCNQSEHLNILHMFRSKHDKKWQSCNPRMHCSHFSSIKATPMGKKKKNLNKYFIRLRRDLMFFCSAGFTATSSFINALTERWPTPAPCWHERRFGR